ncbi:MAG: twin-arginine translocase TatA/TatE family subunit [Solirubrobacteraceae bacterium]
MGLDNPIHLAFILLLVLLVFGAKRLPEMGRALGEGMRGFKDSINPQTPAAPLSAISTPTVSATTAHQESAPNPDPGSHV